MGKKRRISLQREQIYETIKENNNHPTALWLYDHLKEQFSSLSLGNLYRNLRILMEENRVKSRIFRDGIEHFDAVLRAHHHFVCENCSRISDISIPADGDLAGMVHTHTRHKVNSHIIQFYGICEQCNALKKEVTQ